MPSRRYLFVTIDMWNAVLPKPLPSFSAITRIRCRITSTWTENAVAAFWNPPLPNHSKLSEGGTCTAPYTTRLPRCGVP